MCRVESSFLFFMGRMISCCQWKNAKGILWCGLPGTSITTPRAACALRWMKRWEDPDIRRLIFDMRGVEFMDSSGIGMLIGRYKRMKRRGGSVAVTGAEGRIDRIFTMAGLYQIIDKLA